MTSGSSAGSAESEAAKVETDDLSLKPWALTIVAAAATLAVETEGSNEPPVTIDGIALDEPPPPPRNSAINTMLSSIAAQQPASAPKYAAGSLWSSRPMCSHRPPTL